MKDISVERALRYDSWYDKAPGREALKREREELRKILPSCYNSVLEVGCGTGRFLEVLGAKAEGPCIGLDRSLSMLKVASWRVGKRCELVVGDARKLPFKPNSFDVVCLLFVLEFLPDPLGAIAEALRVGRQVVVFGGINTRSLWGLRYWLRRELARKGVIKSSFASACLRPSSKLLRLVKEALRTEGIRAKIRCRGGLVLPPLSPLWELPFSLALDRLLSATFRPWGGFTLIAVRKEVR